MLPLNDTYLASQAAVLPLKLTTIPPELLVQILKYLPWTDVLRVRKVCKHISEATKTKVIWAFFVDRYLAAHCHQPRLRLELPIDLYISDELEHLFLVWESAARGWGWYDDEKIACDRGFSVRTDEYSSAHLIPGGRWMLITTRAGAVTYYDLDAEIITGTELIPPQTTVQILSCTRTSVDVDADSPMLRFRIAFSLIGHGPFASIQLWQVDLNLDNTRRAVGLNATHLASFPKPPTMRTVVGIYLLGPTLAFEGLNYAEYNRGHMCVCVMDWQRATGNPPDYACRTIDNPPFGCRSLIQGNRLLGDCLWDVAKVFDLSRLEAKKEMPIQPGPVGPPFKGNLFDDPQRTPHWYFDEHTSQYVYSAGRSLYRVAVKDAHSESPVSPTPVQLVDGHGELIIDAHAVGRTRAAAVTSDGEVWLTSYDLSGYYLELSYGICKARPTSLHPSVYRTDLLMDEDTGRIVLHGLPAAPWASVVDFALVRKR